MSARGSFNIRVYGLFINSKDEILLSDEERFGIRMTKFPGGGLQYGEGTIDCLKREAIEEFGQEIVVLDHFYTTDFFQASYFQQNTQIISIYYLARFVATEKFRISAISYDFTEKKEETLSFRYKKLVDLLPDELSFPIDKLVLTLLKKNFDK
jgi:8-oxo-dGTP diphosphatase